MLKTALCQSLGIEHPIFSVGFGAAATPELVAAVSNAGGCGVLGTGGLLAPDVHERIARIRTLTTKPFGVNVIIALGRAEIVAVCIEKAVPILVLFWGDPGPCVPDAHRAGTKVFVQVGSVDEARAAADTGVDAIIAQGGEAGGHVKGTIALSSFLPAVVEAVKPVPVIASGGIANGRGIAAALTLGAQAVSLGTRFVASEEAYIPREYKERVVKASAEDTVYAANLFDIGWPDAPHRVLRNRTVATWEAAGRPPSGNRPGEGETVGTTVRGGARRAIPRYSAAMLTPDFDGSVDDMPLWAGISCELVHDIKPAGEIVRDLVRETEAAIRELPR